MYRVLLRLRKGVEVKYLSHRDFVRAFELSLRRAQIPVAYSEGFNPRIKMSFGNALGLGVTSEDERIQLELSVEWSPSEVMDVLNSKLPKGMEIVAAEVVPEGVKSPLTRMNASEYQMSASCDDGCDLATVKSVIEKLLAASEIRVIREREGGVKELDIRPHLLSADVEQETEKTLSIRIGLVSGNTGGAGPRDFVKALKKYIPSFEAGNTCRLRQFEARL